MKDSPETLDRQPAVAGQFYPAHPDKLQHELQELFAAAEPKRFNNVRALISPHAGYVFSGSVAASTYNQLDPDQNYRHVFILVSSHHENLHGASVYCDGDYMMPFGRVKVDTNLCRHLVETHPELFNDNPRPHLHEHSLEVQLPFLNYALENDFSIVPIVLGAPDHHLCEAMAEALKPFFLEKNLFIISSDFCHYPDYTDAKKLDNETKNAILTNDPGELRNTLRSHVLDRVPGLVTSLCGWTSVLTLMYMTQDDPSLEYHAVMYRNSGDTPHYEDAERVVGYWGIVVCSK